MYSYILNLCFPHPPWLPQMSCVQKVTRSFSVQLLNFPRSRKEVNLSAKFSGETRAKVTMSVDIMW